VAWLASIVEQAQWISDALFSRIGQQGGRVLRRLPWRPQALDKLPSGTGIRIAAP
jgi:hypothetical protein